MEKLVSLVRIGFAEEFIVYLLDKRIFMRFSDNKLFCVCLVENGSTESL